MSSNKVKIIGYAKREFYNSGIEYRNFSDNLVGNQFTEDGGTSLFTLGNFRVTTNLDVKYDKFYQTNKFTKYYSLNNLKIDDDINLLGYGNNNIKLNLNTKELSNYAYFGSLKEFIRVSLENIIIKWPASLFITKTNQTNPSQPNDTYNNYSYDNTTNESKFDIPLDSIVNKFGLNIKEGGNNLNTFNESNGLRDFNLSFYDYVLNIGGEEYQIKSFIGYDEPNGLISIKVNGDPFNSNSNDDYHIKPNSKEVKKFYHELNGFENNLLNRFTTPKYKGEFTYKYQSENGKTIIGKKNVIWPVSDGYNIDYDTDDYSEYVINLLDIAKVVDMDMSNIITNRLVSDSILEFDTVEQKIGKTLKIYGRNFDDIKNYVDGIKYINTITYDKQNNIPDRLVKNLARTLGWELTTSLFNVDFNEDFYSGDELNLSPVESEIEFWRRLIINSPWIWKSKGTRKVVEFLLRFVGTPTGLINFNEFIYKTDKAIDLDVYKNILENNDLVYDEETSIVDSEGYPRIRPNTPDMYFQKGGLWYRQTAGPNSNLDVLSGNNPHIGPYDSGYEYINQFNTLIDGFKPTTTKESEMVKTKIRGYVNYNYGKFDGLYSNDVMAKTKLDIDFNKIREKNINECVGGGTHDCKTTVNWFSVVIIDGKERKPININNEDTAENPNKLKERYISLASELGFGYLIKDNEFIFIKHNPLCDDKIPYENIKIEFKIKTEINIICDERV